jgi:hypothetical protein
LAFPPWEGRALRNCLVGNFSEAASLQGRPGKGGYPFKISLFAKEPSLIYFQYLNY